MLKNRFLTCVFILALSVSISGCAGLQRKFTRKKKKEEKLAPVITTYDYSKDLRVDKLYKKHFLFWKTWHTELIDKMDFGYKKRSVCYHHTVENLLEMKKYLAQSKQEELWPIMVKIKSIDSDVKKKRLSKSEMYRMKQLLEKAKRRIDKEFSYSKVKDFLGPER